MTLFDKLKGKAKLLASIEKCEEQVTPTLKKYLTNFPDYTDHSIDHSKTVLRYAEDILSDSILELNSDEAYILIMSCYLHDIGMCPNPATVKALKAEEAFKNFQKEVGGSFEEYLRNIHHEISYKFILDNWSKIGILNLQYAKAIALVSMGHREKDLLDFDVYNPGFIVKSGKEFVCLPFLASILRLADELDITNDRTPDLLFDKFLPDNPISKKEWLKHKDTYFVNFSTNQIIITANCTDLHIYNAIKKQYQKIDSVLKYLQKVIRSLPKDQKQREFRIPYTRIEENITTEGFLPKKIGFSFDLQKTLETFIGKNLYNNNFIAIREVLQNAIDTCHYKKALNGSYSPEIRVILTDNQLLIEDNGMGMDEFIVENFFAKMTGSYYKQKNVGNVFQSIGEFGIGVFSYFMLCDYVEIETKMDGREALKFRITKDANTDFFFYSNFKKPDVGTRVIFFLKETVSYDSILKNVKHFIRHVDIPISVSYKSREEIILSNKFDFEESKVLSGALNIVYQDQVDRLTIIKKYFSNDEYEGIVGLIISKDDKTQYVPNIYTSSLLKEGFNTIALSQQGIFLFNTSRNNLFGLVGDINIKRKYQINLSRNSIVDRGNIRKIVDDFESSILKDLFLAWKSVPIEEKSKLSKQCSYYVLSANSPDSKDIAKLIVDNFVVEVFDNNKLENKPLKIFLKNKKFLFLNVYSDRKIDYQYDINKLKKIQEHFKCPILLSLYDVNNKLLFNLLISLGFAVTLVNDESTWYYLIEKKDKQRYVHNLYETYHDFVIFDSNQIGAYEGVTVNMVYNLKHPIVDYAVSKETFIKENQVLYDLFIMFFKKISSILNDTYLPSYKRDDFNGQLERINSILALINKEANTNFRLSKKDFAPWLQSLFKS